MNTVELIEKIETALNGIQSELLAAAGATAGDLSWEQAISWNYAVSELARIMVEVAKQNR